MPDILALVVFANRQSLEGAVDIAQRAKAQRSRLSYDRAGLLVLPLISRFDMREEYERAESWLHMFHERLKPFFEEWTAKGTNTFELMSYARIPYFSYWSFGEKLPAVEESLKDPEVISYHVQTVAALIARHLNESDLLVANRDTYLLLASKGSDERSLTTGEFAFDIYISYSQRDAKLAQDLASALRYAGVSCFWDNGTLANGDWPTEFDASFRKARDMLVIVRSKASAWQSQEIESFIRNPYRSDRRLLPVIYSDEYLDTFPTLLRHFQYIDASKLATSAPFQKLSDYLT